MTKLKWRRTWFQVHKWIGLILAILIIPLCVSGAALVYDEALDHALHPQRFATSGAATLPAERYLQAAQARAAPGDRVAQVSFGEGRGPVLVAFAPAQAGPPRGGPPARTNVYLDGPTARVLDVAASNAGVLRFLHVLHGSLQIPGGWGRTVVGWIGVAMMISAFTGLWLWWPTVSRLRFAFRWRRHPNLDTNLHQTFGFWIALPLFVLSLTGAWISFPGFFNALAGGTQRLGADRATQMRAPPVAATRLTPATAIDRARAMAPGSVRQLIWPTEKKPDWTVQVKPERGGPVTVAVADDGGVAAITPPPTPAGQNRLMRQIHEGSIGGPIWRLIVFLGGVVPTVLAVTGVIMWWRAKGWKARLAARQQRKLVAGSAASPAGGA